jgi:DNA repair exonuclease SbcCD ATPase subunit
MKAFFWILIVGLTAACAVLYASNNSKLQEITALREANKQLDASKNDAEKKLADRTQAESAELARLREDAQDVLRLRNEVRQLKDQQKQLSGELQTAAATVQAAQAQAQTAQAQAQAIQAQAIQTSSGQVRLQGPAGIQPGAVPGQPAGAAAVPLTAEAKMNACINNLRQVDGAKQQWALENRKTENDIPSNADLAKYLRNGVPQCPGGGMYTIRSVKDHPICSFPGHSLGN